MAPRRILVTGAAGQLGSAVCERLAARGAEVSGMGRGARPQSFPGNWFQGDVTDAAALAAALQGATAIIHCASDARHPDRELAAMQALTMQAARSGGSHVVYVSIAGIDTAAPHFRYYGAKVEAEQRLAKSGLPHSIVRIAQFHPFVEFLLARLDRPLAMVVPSGIALQPVDIGFAADRLVDQTEAGPAGRAADVLGPERIELRFLAKTWLQAQGHRKPVIALPFPIQPFRAFREVGKAEGVRGGMRWSEWLSSAQTRPNPYLRRLSTPQATS